MKILIISVSKKSIPFQDDINEYKKRLSKWVNVEEEILSHSDKSDETLRMMKLIKSDDYVVLLDERGSNLKSEEFAELIDNRMQDSQKRLVFIVGGAYGVDAELQHRANYTMSFGLMVWPHAMCKLMLYEQIYRGYMILNGSAYHHE